MGIDAEMFVRMKGEPSEDQLREWHYKFGCAFHEHLWMFGTHEGKVPENLFLFPIEKWEQDGPDIEPEPGETFLRIQPASRYYGEGYERGNIMVLKAMAEFLELMIPGCTVWYGGDSSGVLAEHFDAAARDRLFKHFVKYQREPYVRYQSGIRIGDESTPPGCPYCKVVTVQSGFGRDYARHFCPGCGWNQTRRGKEIKQGWEKES